MSPSGPVTKMFHFLNKVHIRKSTFALYEKLALKSVGLTSIRCLAKVSVTIGNQYTSGQGYKEIYSLQSEKVCKMVQDSGTSIAFYMYQHLFDDPAVAFKSLTSTSQVAHQAGAVSRFL